MARNRIIYQNELLFVSPSATGNQNLNGDGQPGESLLRSIKRLQSVNYGFAVNRTDTYQFGQLARIDSKVLAAPTVSLDFSYYLTDGKNEHLLGLDTTNASNFLHKDFINDGEGRNYYVYTGPEGSDAMGTIDQLEAQDDAKKSVVAIGNGFVSSYSLNAAVGGMPVVSVSVEGANIQSDPGKEGQNPAINPSEGTQYSNNYTVENEYIVTGEASACLLPGDIEVDLGDASLLSTVTDTNTESASHIQSVSVDLPLGRTNMERLGNAFGYAKMLDVPITASISVSAILADKKSSSQSLFTELYAQNSSDLRVAFRKPSSEGSKKGDKQVEFTFNNAVLQSESYGMSIGDNRTVDYIFTTTIGDPAGNESSSTAGSVQVSSSGVYEQLQVLETGLATDTDVVIGSIDNIAYGHAVAANDDILVIGASGFKTGSYEVGAGYIYKNDKGFYRQVQLTSNRQNGSKTAHHAAGLSNPSYWTFNDDDEDANIGFDVAVSSENLIALGALNSDFKSSAVAILHPNDDLTNWTVNDIVTGLEDKGNSIRLGSSVAFDKQTSGSIQWLAAGAPLAGSGLNEIGDVHLRYGTKGATNSFVGYRISKATEVEGSSVHDTDERFGTSVAIHNGRLVVGAPGYSAQSGVVYVYAGDGTGPHTAAASWVEVAQLSGNKAEMGDPTPALGASVDIYNNTIVAGAPSGKASDRGAVIVYTTNEGDAAYRGWEYAATISPGDLNNGELFGQSVSMPNANTIVVGAPEEDEVNTNAGSVYVFTGKGSNWVETQKLTYSGAIAQDNYGRFSTNLAATQKEIFIGSEAATANKEKVIRYRI